MRPGPGLIRLAALLTALGALTPLGRPVTWVWIAAAAAGVAWAVRAAFRLRAVPAPAVARTVAPVLPLGVPSEVTLRLESVAAASIDVEVFDLHPAPAAVEGLPRRVTVPAGGFTGIAYRLTPSERGDQRFDGCDLLLYGAADLWRRRVRVETVQPVRVVPNFRAVARFALLAVANQLGQIGVKLASRRGEGLEFEELREYREGDSLRRIDWKATSRRGQLISREYEDERNQQVVCLVDCGRRMRARDGAIAHFDQVLNTVLLLAYVALRQGDSIGVLTFSGERRWLPPVKGASALQTILNVVYDLRTSTSPSDFAEAATQLMQRQRRRALVLLISNVRDEDSDELLPAMRLLATRHLVLLASLRESVLKEGTEERVRDLPSALRVAAAHRYLADRRRTLETLQTGGGLVVDVEPDRLPVAVVNRYLEVKRSRRL